LNQISEVFYRSTVVGQSVFLSLTYPFGFSGLFSAVMMRKFYKKSSMLNGK